MDYNAFFLLINAILLVRLKLTFKDSGVETKDIPWLIIVPVLFLSFYTINLSWTIAIVFMIVMPILSYWLDKGKENKYVRRIVQFTVYFIGVAILCSPLFNLKFHAISIEIFTYFNKNILPGLDIESEEMMKFQLVIFGFLLVLNEINFLVRFLLHLFQLEPIQIPISPGKENLDEKEYNTGRVIGMLERVFVYILILSGQYTAIGFILTAKGVVRFKELENRTFAEYVLIGTFVSTLLAMMVALLVEKSILLI